MSRTVSLSGAVFALLCLTIVLFALPAGAQDGSIPSRTTAIGEDSGDSDNLRDVIVVAVSDCTVTSSPTSIILEDVDGRRATFTDGGDIDISTSDSDGRPRIEGQPDVFIGDLATPSKPRFSKDGDYFVVRSTGITCADDDESENTNPTQDQYAGDGDVDKAKDVIVGTTSTKKIPNTGGPPLLVLGALLLGAAVVVGRRVLRP